MNALLVSMPFASVYRPSLALSVLKATLSRAGTSCDVAYLNLAFARRLGRVRYEHLVEGVPYPALPGEWVFAAELRRLLPPGSPATVGEPGGASFEEEVLLGRWSSSTHTLKLARRARALAASFLDDCEARVPWGAYDLVGFTSSGAQNVAALALAGRIKRAHPDSRIVFGGPNWDWPMGRELFARFPFVDYACLGPADLSFPALAEAIAMDRPPPADVPGILFRDQAGPQATGSSGPPPDPDDVATPDHSDYSDALERSGYAREFDPGLITQTGRGCWWAARSPCRFCAHNGAGESHRTMSPERTLRELRALDRSAWGATVEMVDNAVTPRFLADVLPALVSEPLGRPLFFEVRPDVTREQVGLMAAARASVQIGIESFSDRVLRLMRKGSRGLENVRLLLWCRTAGVKVIWNLMYGVPGEREEDYEEFLALLPAIHFLPPPDSVHELLLERFSTYFREPSAHGLTGVRPSPAYRHLYPFPAETLGEIAFSFDFDLADPQPNGHVSRLLADVEGWRRESGHGELRIRREKDGTAVLLDTRPGSSQSEVELDPLAAVVYGACEDIATYPQVLHAASRSLPSGGDRDRVIERLLAGFVERRAMVTAGGRYLSVALASRSAAASGMPSVVLTRSAST